ncbi:MAG: chalcone isomerase family protein [Proteobacteria bacterium]|nr:chalcone isomerase family protein [Pseudomonadota bacterium]
MKKILIILAFISMHAFAHNHTKWVDIGEGTFKHGFMYPYKIKLSVPYGVRNIDEIKKGLVAMKFTLSWLPTDYSQTDVESVFATQLEQFYTDKESFRLSKNLISQFLKELPATKKHETWIFIYFPDEGTRLFVDYKKIHHLVGAELNRALIQSWLDNNPVLTAELFNRLLKIQ